MDAAIHLWDWPKAREIQTFSGHSNEVRTVLFTPDGKNLISGGHDHTVRLWEVATGKEVRQFGGLHQAKGAGTALSPDGKLIASGDGEVYRWELSTGRQIGERMGGLLRTDVSGSFLAFSPDGAKLAVQGISGSIFLWDLKTDREIFKLAGPYGIYNNLAYSPDGKLLAAGGYGNTVRFWDTATGKELNESRGSQNPIFWIGFANRDKSLLAAGNGGARIWDLGTDEEPPATSGRFGDKLALGETYTLSPDGRTLALGRTNEQVRFVDVASGEMEGLSPQDPKGRCVGFMPNGGQIFIMDRSGQTVVLWSRLAGREIRRFVGHVAYIRTAAVSPDGRYLATSSQTSDLRRGKPQPDDSTRLWDVATGRERWRLPMSSWTLAFSPDGRLLAGGGVNRSIQIWETETGKEIRQFGELSYVTQLAFSPDGKTLASTSRVGTVHLWEVLTGQERTRFEGHRGEVFAVAFSADGRRLASGGNDTSVLLWDVTGKSASNRTAGKIPRPQDFSSLWQDLGSTDAGVAYRALWQLSGAEDPAVNFLKEHLRPVQAVKGDIISGLIKDLDSDRFDAREKAAKELENLGELAEPALHQTQPPSLESRRRINELLSRLEKNQSPALVRGLRSIEVLGNIGSPEAHALLKELAGGVAEARLTREAKISLERLDQHNSHSTWTPTFASSHPDGERLLRTMAWGAKDENGRLLHSRRTVRLGPAVSEKNAVVSLSGCGKSLIITDGSPSVRLWDCRTEKPLHELKLEIGDIGLGALSSDGKILAAGTAQRSREIVLGLWDVSNGQELGRLPVRRPVFTLQFTPDGKQLVTGEDDGRAHLWDVATGKELAEFTGIRELISCSAISPNGKILALGERSNVRLYELATGKLLRDLGAGKQYGPGAGSLAFSPDSALLAIGDSGSISFWDPATGKKVFQLEAREMSGVFHLIFSPDGRTLVTMCWQGPTHLWEMATGQIRRTFLGPTDRRFHAAFAADGRPVIYEIGDGSIFVWDVINQVATGHILPASLKPVELAALWDLLGTDKATSAYQAQWMLVRVGQQTVSFIEKNLRPIPKDFTASLQKAMAGLEEKELSLRDAAMNELDCYGSLAEPTMRKGRVESHSAEAQARLAYLLEKQESNFPCGALLRSLRGIEVLEQLGTPEARRVLETIADGHPQALLTREAKASLDRLSKHKSSHP
jgi:WD40 repeat protein